VIDVTNGTTGSKQIITDAGFSDPNWNVGCQVRGNNFGKIAVGRYDQVHTLGTVTVSYSNNLDYMFANVYIDIANRTTRVLSFQAENGETYTIKMIYSWWDGSAQEVQFAVYDSAGNLILKTDRWYVSPPFSTPYVFIVGLGFGGHCKMGAYDSASIIFNADSSQYNADNSDLPPTVEVLIYYQGIPTVLGDIGELRVIGTSDIGKEASIKAEWPKNSDGVNYKCDVQLNAKLRVIQNDFLNKSDIFEEAKLYIYVGGNEYCEVDLLTEVDTSNGAVIIGNAVLPSGSYSDGAYELKVKAKEIPQNEQFVVKCNMVLWYVSGYASLCG